MTDEARAAAYREVRVRRRLSQGRDDQPSAVLALDLGGTQTRTACVTVSGEVHARRAATTPIHAALPVVDQAIALLRDTLAHLPPARRAAVTGIGISAPGPLDPATGRLVDPPNLPRDLWGFPLAAAVSDALHLPAVLERDTQVAALAEAEFGAARDVDDFVYLTVSTGVGGAVVTGGRLLRGPDGAAGELGHLTVDLDGPRCGCGAVGHLEGIASGTAIARAATDALRSGTASPALAEMAREVAPRALGAMDVARAEERGDAVAARIMDYARRAFAAAVVSIVDIFNPDLVVVGGGIAAGQGERLLEPARRLVAAHAFRTQASRAKIVPAALGDDVALIGAVPLVALLGRPTEAEATTRRSGQELVHEPRHARTLAIPEPAAAV